MTCSKKKRIGCGISFVSYGSFLNPEPGKLALDVGNRLCPGVIDHHQPGAGDKCAVSLMLRHPGYVLDHLKDVPLEKVTLLLHVSPDLDAVTSAFFAHHLLSEGRFPKFAERIAAYVRDVDRGICFRHPGVVVTAYSLFAGRCEMIRQQGAEEKWSLEKTYRAMTECGFALWEYLISVMDERTDLHYLSDLKLPPPFQEARRLIEQDYALYLEDLEKSRQTKFRIPEKEGDRRCEVDTLISHDPQSLLFRSWGRGDNRHSPGGKGFVMLVINYGNERYVISTDPQSPFYLKGLGDRLETAEVGKRKRLGQERRGAPRPGYASPDPWYDGRNPLHNYTIVDTPRNGTVLTWEEVLGVVEGYGRVGDT